MPKFLDRVKRGIQAFQSDRDLEQIDKATTAVEKDPPERRLLAQEISQNGGFLNGGGVSVYQQAIARAQMGEVSIVDTRRSTGLYTYPYNPDDLVARRGIRVYDRMRQDDQVRAALTIKKFAALSTGWRVSPPPKPTRIDLQATAFTKWTLQSLVGAFEEDMYEMLTSLDYGFSVTEKIWKVTDQPPWQGKYTYRDLKTIAPHDIDFVTDEHGNLIEIKQLQRPMRPDKFVIFSYNKEFGNWYGTSDLRAAYRPWWIKDNALRWLGIYLEKFAIPMPIAEVPLNISPGEKAVLENVLQNIQAATSMIVSDQVKIDFAKIPTNGAQQLLDSIDGLNLGIARAILLPNLLGLTTQVRTGSLARARKDFELFIVVVDQLRIVMAQTVITEQIIRPLVLMNFPGARIPVFEFSPLTAEQRRELLKLFVQGVQAQAIIPTPADQQYFRSEIGMPSQGLGAEGEVDNPEEIGISYPEGPMPGDLESSTIGNLPGISSTFKFTQSEDRAGLAHVRYHLENLQNAHRKRMSETVQRQKDQMLDFMRKRFSNGIDPRAIDHLQVRRLDELQQGVKDHLHEHFRVGRQHAYREMGFPMKFRVNMTPDDVVKFLDQRASHVTQQIKNHILGQLKNHLLQAHKDGEPLGDTLVKVGETFDPWIDHHLLDSMVRTTGTEAYNEGRKTAMYDPEVMKNLQAVRYSTVMDEDTTPVCRFLHGMCFKPGDAALDKLTPSNHTNCRAVLLPVLNTDNEPVAYITEGQIGQALDLAHKGFV